MPVYVSDLLTATAAPVNAVPTATRTWQWLRGSTAISGATSSTYTAVTADIGATIAASQIETNVAGSATATSAPTEVIQAFDPIRLFSASEPGVWYDPNDITTLFQDAAGTIPVTGPVGPAGQAVPVGLMLDKSRGLVLGPELVTNGTFDSGTTGWSLTGDVTVVDGRLRMFNPSGGRPVVTQSFPTVVGRSYKVTFSFEVISGGVVNCRILRADASTDIIAPNTGTGVFTALDTTTVFYLRSNNVTAGSGLFVDNISVKELPGNHATQSITASQPIYGIVPAGGRRNQLLWSENYSNAVWTKTNLTVSSGVSDPLGGTSAFTVTATGANGDLYQAVTTSNVNHKNSIWVRRRTGTGIIQIRGPQGQTNENITVTSEWQRFTSNAGLPFQGTGAYTGIAVLTAGDAVDIWGAQQELGSTATPYQRVTTQYDVTEAGVASLGYLFFDGSGDFMSTGTITPGTDKAQVFTGVRKLTDATVGMILELSANINSNNGSFGFATGTTSTTGPNYHVVSKGTTVSAAVSTAAFASPISNVATSVFDISGDVVTLRLNGAQNVTSSMDQGTGNFLAYPLYIGRRGGTDLPFNGHIHSLIVRFGPNLTTARISATESWVASKTAGVTL